MIRVSYPAQLPATRISAGKEQVFCIVRKKWMLLTPEEWVRQNMVLFMHLTMRYPLSLMAIEKQLQLGELKKRFDIVVYKDQVPYLLIECKESSVSINQKTLDQALRYNIQLQAPYFIVTNGNTTYGFGIRNGEMLALENFPSF